MEDKVLCSNRQAAHQYFLLERYETGVALTGTEVKSIRNGKANLKDAYASIQKGEAWLINCHVSPYSYGLTLIPTKLYLVKGRIKCEIALARGKKLHDKRETERRKTADREARQAIKYRNA